jgi:hypothetical protein
LEGALDVVGALLRLSLPLVLLAGHGLPFLMLEIEEALRPVKQGLYLEP